MWNETPIMKVYTIENGFLLEFGNGEDEPVTLIYAKDERGVADQIIAQRARLVLQSEMFSEKEMGPERVL